VLALGAWVAVAHNSGSGWVQSLGALLAGFLLVGLVAPAAMVRRARCSIVASPTDAVAGRPTAVTMAFSVPVSVRFLVPPGPEVSTGRLSPCAVPLVPDRRGVHDRCVVQIAGAAPFGILWWTKRVTLDLPWPLAVAPVTGRPDAAEFVDGSGAGDDLRRIPDRVGEPRGVRPYRPGDRRHWVHWPATAHVGSMMVREMESPQTRPVSVRAILPADPEAAEPVAERALGTVGELLGAGRSVVLVTAEPGGIVERPVGSTADAGRRLASALPVRAVADRPRAPRRGPAPVPAAEWLRDHQ
jgi:uncharacterized protein (DUF58 family)